MSQNTVFITGANRGIGLRLAQLHKDAGWRVLATYRDPATTKELIDLIGDDALHLDVKDEAQIAELGARLSAKGIEQGGLARLINNAGIFGPRTSFGDLSAESWLEVFHVNTVAPMQIAHGLAGSLGQGGEIINLSSRMGSITNCTGGAPLYRSSKAALNMAMDCLQKELHERDIKVFVMHPGWVRTDMGGAEADLSVEESADNLFDTMNGFTDLPVGDKAAFYNHDGSQIEW